jgi:hypothetical protein
MREEEKGRRGEQGRKGEEESKGEREKRRKYGGGWRYIKQYFRQKLIAVGAINFRR